MTDGQDFAAWFQRKVEDLGLNDREVAAGAGVTQQYVWMLRNNKRSRPSRDIVTKIAATLDVDVAEALAAANYPHETGRVLIGAKRHAEELMGNHPDWSCSLNLGQIRVDLELRAIPNTQHHVNVRIDVLENDTFLDGREHELKLGESCVIRPFSNDEQIQCEVDSKSLDLVLRVPLSLIGCRRRMDSD